MVMRLPAAAQGNLRRMGYRLETTFGWDTHEIPLYTHQAVNGKERGSVGIRMRVGNPKQLDPAEGQYLARKGGFGFFPWPPEECFDHEFTPVRWEQRKGGGMVEIREPVRVFGCKWCREATPNNGLQGEVEETITAVTEESSVQAISSTPPAATESVRCPECDWAAKPATRSGRELTKKQQLHSLKLHMKRHASKGVPAA